MLSDKPYILYIDDAPENLRGFTFSFKKYYNIITTDSAGDALKLLNENPQVKVVVTDQCMPEINGVELLENIQINFPNTIGILLSAFVDLEALAEKNNKAKIFGYIQKPFKMNHIKLLIDNAIELYNLKTGNEALLETLKIKNTNLEKTTVQLKNQIEVRKETEQQLMETVTELEKLKKNLEVENEIINSELREKQKFNKIITVSPCYHKVLEDVKTVAETSTTVLINGETGTGKELIANAIHALSKRVNKPLVKINCATLPASIIESELFGHKKGSFTGAVADKIGRFEYANEGTIFLDEIGELPLELQPKLLRVLQEGEFQKVGSSKTIKVDVRIIAATNRDLRKESFDGKFRQDLYYRLNVFPIHSIPLRERLEDIPLLTEHFIKKFCLLNGLLPKQIPEDAIPRLKQYSWPGNIRELENLIERSVILSKSSILNIDTNLFNQPKSRPISPNQQNGQSDQSDQSDQKNKLQSILEKCNWKIEGKSGAAKHLGLPASTVRYYMKKYSIIRPLKF